MSSPNIDTRPVAWFVLLTLYQRLWIEDEHASPEDVRAASRKAMAAAHPDKAPADLTAQRRFILVKDASEVLNDPERRRAYDATLAQARTPPSPPRARKLWGDLADAALQELPGLLRDLERIQRDHFNKMAEWRQQHETQRLEREEAERKRREGWQEAIDRMRRR